MRSGNWGVPTPSEWLNSVLSPGSRIGIDPVSTTQTFICVFGIWIDEYLPLPVRIRMLYLFLSILSFAKKM